MADTKETARCTLSREEIMNLGALTDTKGVCAVLGVSERYARMLCTKRAFNAVKVGKEWRVNVESLLAFAGLA